MSDAAQSVNESRVEESSLSSQSYWVASCFWASVVTVSVLALVSLLPLLPSGKWYIRLWDFPRLQLTGLLVVPLLLLVVHVWRTSFAKRHAAVLAVILATAGWQLSHVVPFTFVWPVETPTASNTRAPRLKLLTANIDYKSRSGQDVLRMIQDQDADVVLLIEVDERWAKILSPLDETYPYRTGEVRGEGLGMQLWSRFPFAESSVEHLVSERRPSVFAALQVPGVADPVRYVGVHPTPPALRDRIERNGEQKSERRDSRVRDAELVLVARRVHSHPDDRWIVTGDFNDVAWSRTTRLFKEISRLDDPRVGRRLLNTYHAQRPLLRYPIDHVFVSSGLALIKMDRVRTPGSDHFALATTFALSSREMDAEEGPSSQQLKKASEIVEEGKEDAADREVSDEDGAPTN